MSILLENHMKNGTGLPLLENTLILQASIEGLTPAQILARDELVRSGVSIEEATKAVREASKEKAS